MATIDRLAGSRDFMAAAYYSGAAAPVDNDVVNFDEGGDIIDQNGVQPGIDLLGIYAGPGFRGSVDLQLDVNQSGAGIVEYRGNGEYFNISAGAGGTIAKLVHAAANNRTLCRVGRSAATALTVCEVISGALTIEAACQCATLRILGGDVVAMYHATNAFTNIYANGGRLLLQRDWSGTLYVENKAEVIYDGKGGGGVITAGAWQMTGGLLKWVEGNLGNGILRGGRFDYSGLKGRGRTCGTIESWASAEEVAPASGAFEPTIGSVTPVGGGAAYSTAST